jgi:hypothetical protein
MRRRYIRSDERWEIEVGDESLTITHGGEVKRIENTYEAMGMPADIAYSELVAALPPGFVEEVPDDLLEMIERAQHVTLTGRVRAFYENREYKQHQRWHCKKLDCRVDFIADSVLLPFLQEYYDRRAKRPIKLIAISAKLVGSKDAPDEQQWIGIDPTLANGPVFELFTSGSYEPAYESLDEFLADLESP